MPFHSESQRRYLWVHEPEIARRWAHEVGLGLTIPANPWIRYGVPAAALLLTLFAGRKRIGTGVRVVWNAAKIEILTNISPSIVRPYISHVVAAADRHRVGVFQLIGLGSRESGWGVFLRPKGPAGVGDPTPRFVKTPSEWMKEDGLVTSERDAKGRIKILPPALGPSGERGWGVGLMQIDYASFREWVKTGAWRDPRANIMKGAEVYAAKIAFLTRSPSSPWVVLEKAAAGQRGVQPGRYNDPRPLKGEVLLRAALAAYNTGEMNVLRSIAAGVEVDRTTTGKDYSTDVIGRGREVAAAFKKAGGVA